MIRITASLLALLALTACTEQQGAAPKPADGSGLVSLSGTGTPPETGLPVGAILGLMKEGDRHVVIYEKKAVSQAALAAAPARLCGAQGKSVAESRVKPPEHPEDLPGTMVLIVDCR